MDPTTFSEEELLGLALERALGTAPLTLRRLPLPPQVSLAFWRDLLEFLEEATEDTVYQLVLDGGTVRLVAL